MIHLRTINLEKIDEIKHCCLLMRLDRDDKVRAFISRNFMEWIQKQRSVSDEKIELGKSYVVEKDNRYVGVVGSLSLDRNGFGMWLRMIHVDVVMGMPFYRRLLLI